MEKGVVLGLDATRLISHPIERDINRQQQIDGSLHSRIGFTLGFYFVFELNEGKSIRPEILFSVLRTGYTTVFSGEERPPNRTASDFTFHYLRIPVFFSWQLEKEVKVSIGPYFGAGNLNETAIRENIVVAGDTLTLKTQFGPSPFPALGVAIGGSYSIGRVDFTVRYFRGIPMPVSHSNQSHQEFLSGLHELQFLVRYLF